MEGPKIFFQLPIFGGINITETIVNSWFIIAFVFVLCLVLTHKMEKVPVKKTQIIAEKLVMAIDNLVSDTMGPQNIKFAPYILALFTSSILGSLITLVGMRSTTQDINTTGAWAVATFVMIRYNGIKSNGFIGHSKSLLEPMPFMFPLNLISEASLPFSMALRHFGNVIGGSILMSLIYSGLATLTSMIFTIQIPFLQVGIPAFLSLYFDIFSGAIQAFIFCMLTMVYVSSAMETSE